MTKEEFYLLTELIRETVKSTVKEVIREQQESSLIKKDLKEVKFLLAKVLKEGYTPQSQPVTTGISSDLRSKIREAVGEDVIPTISRTTRNISSNISVSPEQAASISLNGTLPDIDAPIPAMPKNSPIWRDLKEKVG